MTSVAVGLSRDLAAKRVMRAEVQGYDIAVWRDENGGLHAWNNRCPHRGMRLSHGFVRDGHLACLYHGWHFRKDGGCAYIPAHPELEPPETISATVFSITENAGVIWVSATDTAKAPAEDGEWEPLRSLSFACPPEKVRHAIENTPFAGQLPERAASGHLTAGSTALLVHCAPLGDAETLAHLLVAAGTSLAGRKALSRWCETARESAEAGPA
ncbi:Rieske 2Fe-2S domain-containing protein [uncultured Roseobacter sp.]|uniref:Rieske 2Fe-2S domain-containing protein n=1 Tax=uncultured Roseobacter sp. TaxID=114847 RepID=UPI00261A9D7A|nr:Rieske 2Fe-2S domain-containing protein [uncultured Roseobacter sp.]